MSTRDPLIIGNPTDSKPQTFLGVPILSYQQIMSAEIQPPVWDIKDLIAKGQRVFLVAPWGNYKTWLMQHWALHLAAGTPWLGMFEIPKPRRVLYLDKEMGQPVSIRRFQQLALGAGLPPQQELPLHLVPHPPITMDATGAKQLVQELDRLGDVDVLIVETFRRILKGKENEQEDVSAFWYYMEPIFRRGITAMFSHHTRKPRSKKDRGRDLASGSTDVLAGCDGVFMLTRDIYGQKQFATLQHLKNRDAPEYLDGEPFRLQFVFPGEDEKYTGPVVIRPAQSGGAHIIAPQPARPQDKAYNLMRAWVVQKHGQTVASRDLYRVAGFETGTSETLCQRALKRLKDEGVFDTTVVLAKGTYLVRPLDDMPVLLPSDIPSDLPSGGAEDLTC